MKRMTCLSKFCIFVRVGCLAATLAACSHSRHVEKLESLDAVSIAAMSASRLDVDLIISDTLFPFNAQLSAFASIPHDSVCLSVPIIFHRHIRAAARQTDTAAAHRQHTAAGARVSESERIPPHSGTFFLSILPWLILMIVFIGYLFRAFRQK